MILNNADNILLGAAQVDKVMLGDQQVWTRTPPEPKNLITDMSIFVGTVGDKTITYDGTRLHVVKTGNSSAFNLHDIWIGNSHNDKPVYLQIVDYELISGSPCTVRYVYLNTTNYTYGTNPFRVMEPSTNRSIQIDLISYNNQASEYYCNLLLYYGEA
jgi:hypothetical protein